MSDPNPNAAKIEAAIGRCWNSSAELRAAFATSLDACWQASLSGNRAAFNESLRALCVGNFTAGYDAAVFDASQPGE